MFSFRRDKLVVFKIRIQKALGHRFQEVYGKIDVSRISSRHLDISWIGGSAGQDYPVKFFQKFLSFHIFAYVHAGFKDYSFFFHELHSPVNDGFVQLHVGDPVAEKSSYPVIPLKYRYPVSFPVQFLSCRQSGRTAAYYRHFLSGTHRRHLGNYPAIFPGSLDNCLFIVFCGYRVSVNITGTGSFAQSRTHMAGKFRKTVGLGQSLVSLSPFSPVYQIIGLRHQVVQRTAGSHPCDHHTCLAEGNAAFHAAGSLDLLFL